jgi:DNA polymerase III subunit epsilon
MTDHVFADVLTRTCTVCDMTVQRGTHTWNSRGWLLWCPGIRWYPYEDIPQGLATKTTLEREGLRATGEPVACYAACSRKTFVYLYDRALAHPKRALSDKQQAALATTTQALQASRACQGCNRLVQSKRKLLDAGAAGHLCLECYLAWEHEQDLLAIYTTAAAWLADDANGTRPLRVLDTETTGLGEDAEIVELAIVDAAGVTMLHSLVRPSSAIEPDAAAVHGLSAADRTGAPTLTDLWPQVQGAIRGTRILAYNAEFDRRLLAQSAARYGLKRPACRWDCLMELCAALSDDGEHWLSLEAMCWELGVASGGHRALGDARAALDVLRALAQRAETPQDTPAAAASRT